MQIHFQSKYISVLLENSSTVKEIQISNSRWLLIITQCTIKTIKTTLKSNNIKVKDTSQNPVSIHKSEININTVYNCNK